jgi:cellobiose phosphorylase
MLGRGDEALRTVNYILPTNPLNPSEKSGMEPYAIANQYLGPKAPARVGESPMHWITGTCGWLFRGVVEYMLGIQADYDGLRIVPAMPKVWKNSSAHRVYRGCAYDITYTQNEYNGKVSITVDGNAIEGNLLPYFTDGKAHKVDVQIG